MKDTLTSRNHQDFRARYSGTYGWYTHNDTRKLVRINDSDRYQVTFGDDSDFNYTVKVDSGINFEFIPVDKGWFNSKSGQVYFLCRHPARQWKRGIHPDNTLVYNIKQMSFNQGLSFEVLSDIFQDGFNNWEYKTTGDRALSKHFAIDSKNRVWFYNREIGVIDGSTIKLNNDLVYQELTDTLRRKGYNYKVVING